MVQTSGVDENGRPYVEICEGYRIKLELDNLDDESLERARSELRETPENVEKGLSELRKLLEDDKDLYVPYEIDDFLIKFLRPSKFDAEAAYDMVKKYYKFKQKYPKYCKNLSPQTTKMGFEKNIVSFQPKRDQEGARIVIMEGGKKWNPQEVPLMDLFKAIQMSLEVAMLEPMTQINGCVTIIDMEGLSLQQIMQFTPSFASMMLEWVQECIPLRLKAVHIINNSYLFNMLFAVFKPFISAKLRNRIFFHGRDRNSILKHIDASVLRPEYGGTLPCEPVDGKLVAKLLLESQPEFELANTFGYVSNGNVNRKPVVVPAHLLTKVDANKNLNAA